MRSLAILLALFAPCAGAANYVVSPSGDDTDPGTLAEPWKTLQKAAATVVAGDTVEVRAGSYAGMNVVNKVGTAPLPITFRNYPGEEPLVNAAGPVASAAINVDSSAYIVIEGFRVTPPGLYGIRVVASTFVTVRGNRVQGASTSGIFGGFCNDLLVEDNLVTGSVNDVGLRFDVEADRVVLRGNVLLDNNGGIRFSGDTIAETIGLFRDLLVERNRVRVADSAVFSTALGLGGVQDSTFRNNLFYNVPRFGVVLWKDVGAGPSTNNEFVHNTFVLTAAGRWAFFAFEGSTGTALRNNIFYNANPSLDFGSVLFANDSLANLQSDRNAVIDRMGLTNGVTDTVVSLAQWLQQTGQDQNSVFADPQNLFADAASANYRLREGSAAIDAGEARPDVLVDLDGLPRPEFEGWDIGAYEFRNLLFSDGFE